MWLKGLNDPTNMVYVFQKRGEEWIQDFEAFLPEPLVLGHTQKLNEVE